MICLQVLGLHLSWVEIRSAFTSARLGTQSIKRRSWLAFIPLFQLLPAGAVSQLQNEMKGGEVSNYHMMQYNKCRCTTSTFPPSPRQRKCHSNSPIITQINKQPRHCTLEIPPPLTNTRNTHIPLFAIQMPQYIQHERIVNIIKQSGIDTLRSRFDWSEGFLLSSVWIDSPSFIFGNCGD